MLGEQNKLKVAYKTQKIVDIQDLSHRISKPNC